MAEDLADLPQESIEYAIAAWRRGDASHLSSYQQDHARIGVFFPKPAELRAIAEFHHRERLKRERDRQDAENEKRVARHRAEHPEEYVDMANILTEFYSKRGMRKASTLRSDEQFSDPKDRMMAAFSRAMYAGAEYEPAVVDQVHEWRGKQEAQRGQS